MKYRSLKGSQGNWLIEVTWEDGSKSKLPSAHTRFFANQRYTRNAPGMLKYPGKLKSWREALLDSKMVVLTRDEWSATGHPKRESYVGIYTIDDLQMNEAGEQHSFKITGKLEPR